MVSRRKPGSVDRSLFEFHAVRARPETHVASKSAAIAYLFRFASSLDGEHLTARVEALRESLLAAGSAYPNPDVPMVNPPPGTQTIPGGLAREALVRETTA